MATPTPSSSATPPPPPPPPGPTTTPVRRPATPHQRQRYYTLRIPLLNRIPILRNLRIPLVPFCLNMPRHIERFTDCFVYILGPILILVASGIILTLSYTFFHIILPKYLAPDGGFYTLNGAVHTIWVVFLLWNVCFNYAYCVCTKNGGERYEVVVRELADCMGFVYPETEGELEEFKRDYEQKMIHRSQMRRQRAARAAAAAEAEFERRQQQAQELQQPNPNNTPLQTNDSSSLTPPNANASSGNDGTTANVSSNDKQEQKSKVRIQPSPRPPLSPTSSSSTTTGTTVTNGGRTTTTTSTTATTTTTTRTSPPPRLYGWMLLGPHEWGYCNYSKQPKPPRSHYDHVMKVLCLNMDHYCPWMFNVVGYFNYRYFCNFLFYVFIGMFYGAIVTFHPFFDITGNRKHKHSKEWNKEHSIAIPNREDQTPVVFTFMLSVSVGIAVFCLLAFHVYLIFTAQTTIEFHGNCSKKRRARNRGTSWVNPYDLGWKDNWRQVYGSMHPILAMLPSSREPEFFPFPINRELGRRKHIKSKEEVDGNGDDSVPTAAISMSSTSSSSKARRRVGANDSERVALVV